MKSQTLNKKLFSFLEESTSPFHAASAIKNILLGAEFAQLNEYQKWNIQPGKPRFLIREDGALVAFNIGKKDNSSFRIVAAHTDSPCLKLKPKPDVYNKSYHQLGVEVYGGALLNPWFDRELSISGRISYSTPSGQLESKLIDFKRPVAIIPSVAIHLDREANKEKKINPQKDILPIFGLDPENKKSFADHLQALLAEKIELKGKAEILSYDLFCYDTCKPGYTGINKDFIVSSRLDNLLSCFILANVVSQANTDNSFMLVCNNHEEIGSLTASGAQGNLLESVFRRLYPSPEERYRILANSFLVSVDNAHALHPNFPEKYDSSHDIELNTGPVLKINANHKYASTSISNGLFKMLCQEKKIQVQEFVMRNDMACGSTIGPTTAAKLGIKTVDIGIASLAMHSIREMTGSKDPIFLHTVLNHFLQRDQLPHANASI